MVAAVAWGLDRGLGRWLGRVWPVASPSQPNLVSKPVLAIVLACVGLAALAGGLAVPTQFGVSARAPIGNVV